MSKLSKAKHGDIVCHTRGKKDFFGIVTAYGLSATCDSKAWVRVLWTSRLALGEEMEFVQHLARELEVISEAR